jgi:transposase-like protein
MEERFKFVQEHKADDWSFAELCRRYGVSRKTGYKWLERYELDGLEGLQDQSRAPDHHRNEVVKEVTEEVLDLRRQHRVIPQIQAMRKHPNSCWILQRSDGQGTLIVSSPHKENSSSEAL